MDTDKVYYCYSELEQLRKTLVRDDTAINFIDHGAGNHQGKRKISEIAQSALSSEEQCRILFNLISFYKPNTILEFGTALGLSTLYMAKAAVNGRIFTMEGNPDSQKMASDLFKEFKQNNIHSLQGNFDDLLDPLLKEITQVDLAFIDGNHRGDATLRYYTKLKPLVSDNGILVLDDIYWSPDMKSAWQTIIKDEDVSLSIDLFDIGIVFFNKKFSKEHHVLIDYWKKPWKLGIFG